MSGNLFGDVARAASAEEFRELLCRPGIKIERIVSTGQCSPPGFWYDEPQAEWVILLRGEARLRFEDEAEIRTLRPGD